MSELMSNPQSEPEPRSTAPSGPVAQGGPDGSDQPGIVVRYDAVTDRSDPSGEPDDGDVEGDAADPRSGSKTARRRTQGLLGTLTRNLLAMAWAVMRTAYRYPRWAGVIVFSVLILGATALTRPGNPTPRAEIKKSETGPPSSSEARQDPKKDGKEPKEIPTTIANAAPTATPKPKEEVPTTIVNTAPSAASKPKEESKDTRSGETAVSGPALDRVAVPAPPAAKVADARPTNPTIVEGSPPRTDAVPAPPPLTTPPSTTLLAGSPDGQAPAPAPPTLTPTASVASPSASPAPAPPTLTPTASAASPSTPPASTPGPNPEVMPLPSSETHLSPAPASTPTLAAEPSAESGPPMPGEDKTSTGRADGGNAPLPTSPARDPADEAAGSNRPSTVPTGAGPASEPSAPTPGPTGPGPSPIAETPNAPPSGLAAPTPLPPVTAPLGPIEPDPKVSAPKSDQPAPPATQTGESRKHPTAHAEAVASGPPEDKPTAKAETKAIKPPQPGPTDGPETSEPKLPASVAEPLVKPANSTPGPGEAPAEKPAGADAPKPDLLLEEVLKPGHEGPSPGSSGVMGPKADDRPLSKEPVPVPATLREPPMPPPASQAAEPKTPETAPRDEVGGVKSSIPVTESSGSAPQPVRDLAEAGWVRIPNRGRVSPDVGEGSDAPAGAGRRGPDPSFERQPRANGGQGFEAGSVASSVAETDPPQAPRGGAGRSRVEPSLHVVDRGENFWTISRLYYGDGRYYRALWKANSQKYPDIKKIHINDVILIPAVEDLDPVYIGSPRPQAVAGRDEGSTRDGVSGPDGLASAGIKQAESFPTTRTARTPEAPGGDTLARRGGRVDAELELPVGDADNGPARGGREAMADQFGREDDHSPATRLTARPRNRAAVDRPVYKVRRYDTLRSIARDILGDSRRADELYDINREVIADPTRLVPGQLLELPEDANTRRVTIRDRYRGRD